MNTNLKKAIIVIVGSLAIMTLAIAQTAFKADGIIESTQGGFKFPDESIQTSASGSSIEYYRQNTTWLGDSSEFSCSFDLPPGKIMKIERVSGRHSGSGDHQAIHHIRINTGGISVYLLPTVSSAYSSTFIFDAKTVEYVDGNFFVFGNASTSSTNFSNVECAVVGRLYDAPAG